MPNAYMHKCLHALISEQRPLAVIVLRGIMRCPRTQTPAYPSDTPTLPYSPDTPTMAYPPDTPTVAYSTDTPTLACFEIRQPWRFPHTRKPWRIPQTRQPLRIPRLRKPLRVPHIPHPPNWPTPKPDNWPRGVTVSTLDSESSDRGSNPRGWASRPRRVPRRLLALG